jgi:hypothetical protein
MSYNPFTECYVQENEDSGFCWVASKYWRIPVESKAAGERLVLIIRGAYNSGVSDNQNAIKDALGIRYSVADGW